MCRSKIFQPQLLRIFSLHSDFLSITLVQRWVPSRVEVILRIWIGASWIVDAFSFVLLGNICVAQIHFYIEVSFCFHIQERLLGMFLPSTPPTCLVSIMACRCRAKVMTCYDHALRHQPQKYVRGGGETRFEMHMARCQSMENSSNCWTCKVVMKGKVFIHTKSKGKLSSKRNRLGNNQCK